MDRVESPPPPLRPLWHGTLIVAVGATATGVGLWAHDVWRAFPAERLLLSLVLAGLVAAAAWPLRRSLAWSAASAFAIVWLALLTAFVGPLAIAATALLTAAAWALGEALVPRELAGRAPVSIVAGLLLIALPAGWVITLPIHHRAVWLLALLIPIFARRHALYEAIAGTVSGWRGAVAGAPRIAAAAVMLLGLASTACWVPAMQADDLAFHLTLPNALIEYAAYAPQPEFQKWAYAPWAGDTLHGIVSVLAGGATFGALNAVWMALCAGLVGASLGAAFDASPRERWVAVAVFASFPPLVWMAAGLQTELPATAVLLGFAVLAFAPVTVPTPARTWLAGSLLFAGLFALKLVHGVAALPLLAIALWRYRHVGASRLMLAAAAAAVFGASSYTHAWLATGNPVLPLFNDVFASPYANVAPYTDARWLAGFGPDILWRLTFDTDRYVEGWDGGLGFGLVALVGLWAMRLAKPAQATAVMAVTLVVLLPLVPMQYARYAWPGIVLLIALLVFGAERTLGRRPFSALFIGLCLLNLGYQANASWIHHSAALKRTIRSLGDDSAVLPHYFSERILLRHVDGSPDELVLASDPERNVVAELAGRGRTVSPHDPSLAAEAVDANADASGRGWVQLMKRERIRWVLVSRASASPALDAALIDLEATKVDALNGRELWKLPSDAH